MNIDNTQQCFVQLWLRLEHTRRLLRGQHKRFCIRHILKDWFGSKANDDFIWEVSLRTVVDDQQVCGWDELPSPKLHPRKHREFLRALVSVTLGIGMRKVSLRALDRAYSEAFPQSTSININKQKIES